MLPNAPVNSTDYRRWAAWGVRLLGIAEIEISKRAESNSCLKKLKDKGVIR